MIKCPRCGRDNWNAAKVCVFCGAIWGEESFDDRGFRLGYCMVLSCPRTNHLILSVHHTNKQFVFDADQVEDLSIGRKDSQTGESPDVDLEPYGGFERGVSRKHAAIVRKDGSFQIMDSGSPNGTFLNGQKLVPRQPRLIRDGDDIRLGHLVLHIRFQRGTGDNPMATPHPVAPPGAAGRETVSSAQQTDWADDDSR